ncbi:ABC transporter ATP-binding protein [Kribbella solani]|uniref:Oligopeptide/dipeptide ABC transporter ATP-binding protein n=1 Tax=Kribbella solani TaxID=236067 RepID=A0A841DX51_9ACTN|nr:ABC transporter ATP-binding protein [Kribbella solani]MBB5983734.1 oligopeptide/dipeptide ABC transporter ATP-binding protein [Kribbella solani]
MIALLELRKVGVEYAARTGFRNQRLRVVDDVDLAIGRGEIVGLVGESGCGKSTLARTMVGLVRPATGQVLLDGEPLPDKRPAATRRRIQMVFQDPGSSLDPRHTVERILRVPLRLHHLADRGREAARILELLDLVGLPKRVLSSRSGALSGGQRQRVAIARAVATAPDLIVADEAVAALDASVTGAVLNVLADLRKELGLTVVFISHDLSVVRGLCDRVAVMYLGKVVEEASAESLFTAPAHPYTRALLNAVPRVDVPLAAPALLGDEPPSLLAPPSGCRFHPRCPAAYAPCSTTSPPIERQGGRSVQCHLGFDFGSVMQPDGVAGTCAGKGAESGEW